MNMKRHTSKASAIIAGAALVAALGLAGCGGSQAASSSASGQASEPAAQSSSAQAASSASATGGSTVEALGLEKAWVGQGEDSMTYYFEGAGQKTGALLVYYMADNSYERWAGSMEASGDQAKVVDGETGEAVVFAAGAADGDGNISITMADGAKATLSPMELADVADVLDTIGTYATKVGEEPVARTAEELGGEFVIQVNTEGDGEVAYAQNGEDMGYTDSAFTHADAGDVITLKAKAGKYDSSSRFVKWTKDGADFSTEPEVEATVDGDAEFVAVFE